MCDLDHYLDLTFHCVSSFFHLPRISTCIVSRQESAHQQSSIDCFVLISSSINTLLLLVMMVLSTNLFKQPFMLCTFLMYRKWLYLAKYDDMTFLTSRKRWEVWLVSKMLLHNGPSVYKPMLDCHWLVQTALTISRSFYTTKCSLGLFIIGLFMLF